MESPVVIRMEQSSRLLLEITISAKASGDVTMTSVEESDASAEASDAGAEASDAKAEASDTGMEETGLSAVRRLSTSVRNISLASSFCPYLAARR